MTCCDSNAASQVKVTKTTLPGQTQTPLAKQKHAVSCTDRQCQSMMQPPTQVAPLPLMLLQQQHDVLQGNPRLQAVT
jgi:short-subunit dehydrogenase